MSGPKPPSNTHSASRIATYPITGSGSNINLSSGSYGQVYAKEQKVEIKSILYSLQRKHAWGGGSGHARGNGPLWIDAIIECVNRGGAGNYDVYVPQTPDAKVARMSGTLYRRVPSHSLRPRRRRNPTTRSTTIHIPTNKAASAPRKSIAVKLPEQRRSELAEAAVLLRSQARARAAKASRMRVARMQKRQQQQKMRRGKLKARTRSRCKSMPESKAQSQRRTLCKMLDDIALDLGDAIQNERRASEVAEWVNEKARKPKKRSGLRSHPFGGGSSLRGGSGKVENRKYNQASMATHAYHHGTIGIDTSYDERRPVPIVKDYDWAHTWKALDDLDSKSRTSIFHTGEQNSALFEAFDLGASLDREKAVIRRLWSILQVPRALTQHQRTQLFGKPPSKHVYSQVLQQATWLRQCLAKLLDALRAISRREKMAKRLGQVIHKEVAAECLKDESSELTPRPAASPVRSPGLETNVKQSRKASRRLRDVCSNDVSSAVLDLITTDASCSAAILAWINVSPWVHAKSFKYRGERYLMKLEKDKRFLHSLFHLVVNSRLDG